MALAEEPPLVMLELEKCDELPEAEVRRIVAAELGARTSQGNGVDVTQINVSCNLSRVTIHVTDPLSRKTVQRSFDVGLSDPRARARLVAIAATELVLASWTELESNPKLHVEPLGPPPPPQTTEAARAIAKEKFSLYEPKIRTWSALATPRDRAFRIAPLVSLRGFFDYPGLLSGGGLRFGEERFRWLSWSLDALLESGTVHDRGVTYDVTTATAGGIVSGYVRSGFFTGRLGAGLRAGIATTASTDPTVSGTSTLASWGWPLAASSFSVRITPFFGLEAGGEGGYVTLPIAGDGRALRGFWFSGQVGIAFYPGALEEGPEAEGGE